MNDKIKKAYLSKELISLKLKNDSADDYLIGIIEGYDESGIVLCNVDYRGVESAHIYLEMNRISTNLEMPCYLDKIKILLDNQREKGEYLNFSNKEDVKKIFLKWIWHKDKVVWIRLVDEDIHGYIYSISGDTVNIEVMDEITGKKNGHVLILISYIDYFGVDIEYNDKTKKSELL